MTPPRSPSSSPSPASERLYALLPSLLRLRDGEVGQPLRALLRVCERELVAIEADIAQLYDNWFIETCEPWVVPYLADLLGIAHLPGLFGRQVNRRSFVANTLSYRRRKGTPGVMLQLAHDLTDWPGRVVEYAPFVASSQHVLRPRPARQATLDLRSVTRLQQLGSPFDDLSRVVDVRSILAQPGHVAGRHNLSNVGLFLWRRSVVSVADAVPGQLGPHRFAFSPLGHESPLFQPDRTPPGRNVTVDTAPAQLTSRQLREDLQAGGRTYFAAEPPVVAVRSRGQLVPPSRIDIRDLSNGSDLWDDTTQLPPGRIAIDPELGRLLVAPDFDAPQIRVSYSYSTAGELGDSHFVDLSSAPATQVSLRVPLSQRQAESSVLQAAMRPVPAATSPWVVQIEDSAHYLWPDSTIEVPAGQTLILRAAPGQRPLIVLPDENAVNNRSEEGERFIASVRLGPGAKLILQGLLFAGSLAVSAGGGAELTLDHCMLAPDARTFDGSGLYGQLLVNDGDYALRIDKSIINHLSAYGSRLLLSDSFLLGGGEEQLRVRQARIERSTLRASLTVTEQLEEASDSIFENGLDLEGRGDGCVRFCYLRPPSEVLNRFRCVPQVGEDDRSLRLLFVADHHAAPGFGQLSRSNSPRILKGASDGGELGAMNHRGWQQREADLRSTLAEYTRVGYDTEIFFED